MVSWATKCFAAACRRLGGIAVIASILSAGNYGDALPIAMTSSCGELEAPIEPRAMVPAELGKFIGDETEKWGRVIRAADIRRRNPVGRR
jgi:hypothetical protein